MFTPEGYWSWSETVDAAKGWALELVAASIAPEISVERLEKTPYECRYLLSEILVSSKRVENLNEAAFAMDLLELWVLANYMDTYDAVLCSPEGRTLRCPPIIKAHGDAFDWWLWPLSGKKIFHGEASNYIDAFRRGAFGIADARARFCTIDYETGTVRLKPNTVKLLSSASYGHSGTIEGYLRFIDQQIRPIVGWSICWNEADVPQTHRELYETLGFGEIDWAAREESSAKRESRKKAANHVLECILAAFPDGKGDATWPDVEAKVGYSRRSIVRSLKQNGLHSKWASTGQRQ